MNAVKQIIKNVLPPPLLQQARIMQARVDLMGTPRQTFNTTPLRADINQDFLNTLFHDQARQESWEQTLEKITAVYGKTTAMGGVNPGDRRALYYLVHGLKPQNLLEVGTHIGASTVFVAEALKTISPQARMTTVDILDVNDPTGPWYQHGLTMAPRDYLEKLGSKDRVTFKAIPSASFLRDTKEKFDFIFLDGDHGSRTVYEEVSLALEKLSANGVILLHDYYPGAKAIFNDGNIIPGPFMALDRIMRENKGISVMPLGDLPWRTKNGLNTTSLALVTRK